MKRFLENPKLDKIIDSKVKLLYDSQVTIATIKNSEVGPKGKDIEFQHHYILDMIL